MSSKLFSDTGQLEHIFRALALPFGLGFCIQGAVGEYTSTFSTSVCYLLFLYRAHASRGHSVDVEGREGGEGEGPGFCRAGAEPAAVPRAECALFWSILTIPPEGW